MASISLAAAFGEPTDRHFSSPSGSDSQNGEA